VRKKEVSKGRETKQAGDGDAGKIKGDSKMVRFPANKGKSKTKQGKGGKEKRGDVGCLVV